MSAPPNVPDPLARSAHVAAVRAEGALHAVPRPLPGPDTASPRVREALLSLQNSRAALRGELMPPEESAAPSAGPARRRGGPRLWLRRLRQWPAARLVGEAVQHWWRRHPWQPVGETLMVEAQGQLWPLVRRHPWAAVGVAAATGAAVIAARPWRWGWVERQVRSAPTRASGWLMRQLTSAPVQATLASLIAMAAQRAAQTAQAAAQPAPGPVVQPTSAGASHGAT